MKRVFKVAAILAGIAIIGCNRIDLVAPALISPADGAALYSGLAFIWGAGEEAEEYVIHVWTGSTDVIEDTLTDTTYTMSDSAFSALAYGIYNWAVASKAGSKLEWSESWSFSLTQPGAPKLIAPQDSAVFDTEPPTFIWSSDSLEPDYVIRIFTDTTIDLQDTLADTTYTMSDSVFENLSNGTYNWQAGTVVFNGVLLSETRSFIVDKPPPPLDLDTTYFPFGLGYEWCYESHHVVWEDYEKIVDSYSTFTLSVTDSFWQGETLLFGLEGYCEDMPDTVKIWSDSILIDVKGYADFFHFSEAVSVFDPDTINKRHYAAVFKLRYNGDTLAISAWEEIGPYSYFPSPTPWVGEYIEVRRLKGIGIVFQSYSYWASGGDYHDDTSDRLLYFYNGQDTVWP